MLEFDELSYVFPAITRNDVSDHRTVNVMKHSQFSVGRSSGKAATYCPNPIGVQLRTAHHWAVTPAALVNTVTHVVFLRSHKQMIGSHARRVVAFVQNLLASSKCYAVMQFVRKTVGQLSELARRGKDSITLIVASASPNPAPLVLINPLPKQPVLGLDQRDGIAIRATEFCASTSDLVRLCGKGSAASFTDSIDQCPSESAPANKTTGGLLTSDQGTLTVLTSAWYFLVSQGMNLQTLGLALVRPARELEFSCGPLRILAPIQGTIYAKQ